MRVGVGIEAFSEKNLAVATFAAAHEKDEVVAGGKLTDLRYAVSHRATNGVVALQFCPASHSLLHRLDNLLQFLHTFGGLAVEIHVAAKVYLITSALPEVCPTSPFTSA